MVALGYAWNHTSTLILLDMPSTLPVFNETADGILLKVQSVSITIYLQFIVIIFFLLSMV